MPTLYLSTQAFIPFSFLSKEASLDLLQLFYSCFLYHYLFLFRPLGWGLQSYKANCQVKSAQLVVELWMTPQNHMPQGFQAFEECTHAVLVCSCSDKPSNGAVLSVCQITRDLYLCNSSPVQSSDTQTQGFRVHWAGMRQRPAFIYKICTCTVVKTLRWARTVADISPEATQRGTVIRS